MTTTTIDAHGHVGATGIDARGRAEFPRALKNGAAINVSVQGGAYRIDLSPANLANDTPGSGDIVIAFRADGSAYLASLGNLAGGLPSADLLAAFLASLPSSDAGLSPGDVYWNGDALFRNGGASSGGGSSGGSTGGGSSGTSTVAGLTDATTFAKALLTGGTTASAFLDLLLGTLPTTTPTTSGTWWLNAGVPTKTA